MWSQRAHLATRLLQTTRQCAGALTVDIRRASAASALVIVEAGSADLRAPRQVHVPRHIGKRHVLTNQLIGAVLASGLDEHRVIARGDVFALIVLAVPFQRVLPG